MARRFTAILGIAWGLGLWVAGATAVASAWSLRVTPTHAVVEESARAILKGPDVKTSPVLVVVEDGSPLRFAFKRVGPGRYRAAPRLLVPGTLTLRAMEGSRVLATATVTVNPRKEGSGLRVLAGLILLGFVLWFWYRSRQLMGSR